jgi:4-hydroxy-3-polyprenylbenzoate decarboxylase
MHGLWGMGQMMFTKYLIVVDEDVNVHNLSEVMFRLCSNTEPRRDTVFTKGPADVLDHATDVVGAGSKLGFDATRKLPGEGFDRTWPPLIQMDAAIKERCDHLMRQAKGVSHPQNP